MQTIHFEKEKLFKILEMWLPLLIRPILYHDTKQVRSLYTILLCKYIIFLSKVNSLAVSGLSRLVSLSPALAGSRLRRKKEENPENI